MNLTIYKAKKEDALTVAGLAIQMWEDNVLEELAAELAELMKNPETVSIFLLKKTVKVFIFISRIPTDFPIGRAILIFSPCAITENVHTAAL